MKKIPLSSSSFLPMFFLLLSFSVAQAQQGSAVGAPEQVLDKPCWLRNMVKKSS